MNTTHEATLLFPIRHELYLIDCNNVLYLEADDHYTHVYYLSGAHFMLPFCLATVTDKIVNTFSQESFLVRVGRKFVINMHAIFHINTVKEVLLLMDAHGGNHSIHLPKKTLRELMDKMGNV